jgi:glycerol 3-phosphatase-2
MTPPPDGTVAGRYDALFLDLDGVIYRGDESVQGAAEAVRRARHDAIRILFLTNNSARTPEQVVQKLERVGVQASADEILTSGAATAAMLASEGSAGQDVFVIGERGVREALEAVGMRLVDGDVDRADTVVVGWDRSVDYAKLRTAALLIQRGARLIATNADPNYPAPDGLWPGAGSILAAVTTATGARPLVVGKPAQPLFRAAAERTGARNPLVVGDRLDTDVGGAAAMGWDSLFVMTGAHGPSDLIHAAPLPTYAVGDLSALWDPIPPGRFRRAEPADAEAVGRLLESAGLAASDLTGRLPDTLVCDGGPEGPAATGCLEVRAADGFLRSVAVAEPVRGYGLGLLVVAAAIAGARAANVARVWLFTETAAPFFERLGFQPVARGDLPHQVLDSPQARDECAESATAMVLTTEPREPIRLV